MTMIWKNSFLKIEGNLSGIKFNNFYFIQIVLDLHPQCV